LILEGYNCKQYALLKKIIETIAHFKVSRERFEILKEETFEEYINFWVQQPYQRANYQATLCLDFPRWSNEEYHTECPSISFDEIVQFIPKLLKDVYFNVFVLGNVASQETHESIESIIIKIIGAKPLPLNEIPRKFLVKLSDGKEYINRINSFNEDDENSAASVTFQIGYESNKELLARLELFSACTTSSSFNQLRTVEQLGYIVWSGNSGSHGVSSFRVIVQSHSHDASYLEERIAVWIESVKKELEDLSEQAFEDFRSSLIVTKLEKDKSLAEEFIRFKAEIEFPRARDFGRAEKEAEAIGKLSKKDILEFYTDYIAKNGKHVKKISCLVYSHKKPKGENLPKSCSSDVIQISDFHEFSKKMPHYTPVHDWTK